LHAGGYTERLRADFVLAFWKFAKNIEIIDKNLFFAEEFNIFQIKTP
jgi:hypothetical protein